MKSQTKILTAAAALLLAVAAQAQVTLTDIGTTAPTPGAMDISQLSTNGTGDTPGLNYYWDDGHQNPGVGYPGQSFTTLSSSATGYTLTSLAVKTDGNGGNTPTQTQSFTLAIYELSGVNLTNATLLTTYTATSALVAEGDWMQWTGLGVNLATNASYGYGFGITPGNPENWERMSTATNLPYTGGQVCLIPNAGGKVTYSTQSNTFDATFDIGLSLPGKPIPAAPIVSPASASIAAAAGESVTLTATSAGLPPFTWQWQTDGGSGTTPTNIPGSTSSTLVVNTIGWAPGTYVYDFVASNTMGSATSATADIVITAAKPAISVQFEGNGQGSETLTPAQIAGYVPEQFWNVDNKGSGGTASNLVDFTGIPTGAAITVDYTSGQYGSSDSETTPDGILMSGGFWSGGGYTVNVTGVPYALYNVYVYMLNDNNPDRRYGLTLGAQTYWGAVFDGNGYVVPPYTVDTQTTQLAEGSQMEANVVIFTNIVGNNFTITGLTPDGNVAMMGIEISEPAVGSGPPVVGVPVESSTEADANISVVAGHSVTLSDLAVGPSPISYQWQTDGGSGGMLTNISGAISTNFVINTTGLAGTYVYDLVASNSFGVTVSSAISVVVVPAVVSLPAISVQFQGSGQGSETLIPSQTAGFDPEQFWNVANEGSTGVASNLVDSVGNPTGTSVAVTYGNGQYGSSDDESTPDGIMMSGGFWSGDGYTIKVAGVPYAAYDVLLYMLNDNNPNRRYGFTLGSQTYWGSVFNGNGFTVTPYTLDTQTTELPEGTQMQADLVEFADVQGGSFTITGVTPDGNVALMGMEIYDAYVGPPVAAPISISPSGTYYAGLPLLLSEMPVSGATPFSYQWLTDGGTGGALSPILTGTNSTLALNTTTLTPGTYNYEVIVTNSLGISTSAVLAVSIISSPPVVATNISPAPTNEAYVGQTVMFTAAFAGNTPITYQWVVNTGSGATNIPSSVNPSAITDTLIITNVQLADAGTYSLVANNNAGGPISSGTSTLTVLTDIAAPASGTYGALELTDGPVAYWRFSETEDPITGILPAFDSSGDNFDALYGTNSQNGFNTIAGPQSPAWPGFEANNTALQTANAFADTFVTTPPLNLNTNTVSITMWIYPTTAEGTFWQLFKYQNQDGSDAAGLGFGGTINGASMAALGYTWNSNSATTYNWNSGLFPLQNQWSFVGLVISPSNAAIYLYYIDPVTMQPDLYTAINPITNAPERFNFESLIGTDPYSPAGRAFSGSIDEVAVFNKSLTSDEMLAMFSKAAGLGAVAPQITGEPQSIGTFPNKPVTFAATGINGTSPLSYQWEYITATATNKVNDGGDISGATTPTLTINNATSTNSGSYELIVTNSAGSATSSVATLIVLAAASNSYEAAVQQYGPLAFWPLNETNVDPGSGAAVAYEYVSGLTGTYQTGAQDGFNGIVGPESPALPGFPATNWALQTTAGTASSYVTASAGALIASNLTYTMWINPSAPAATFTGLLMDRGAAGEGFGFGGTTDASGMPELGYTWNQNNGNTWGFNSSLYPTIGQWSFVAMVIEPSQATLYLVGSDGVLQSAVNAIPQDSEEFGVAWHIGDDAAGGTSGGRTFSGDISSVAVYLSALTSDQVATLADIGLGITPPPPQVTIDIAPSTTKGSLTLSWSQGSLLEATNLSGPWTTNTSAISPFTVAPTNSLMFFKVLVN